MLTQERLKELFHYDPETGLFTCLVWRGGTAVAGSIAGCEDHGYIRITIDGERHYGHRLAWLYMKGVWPDPEVDHEDTNRCNNKWTNLREANKTQNGGNVKRKSNNTSGIKGVWWNKYHQKWTAEIMINQQKISLGHFIQFADAVAARHKADEKYFGEYKRIEQLRTWADVA